MNEAVETVRVADDETLRLGRTPVRPRCQDRVEDNVIPGAPVPANVPGDFTVRLGDVLPAWVLEGLEEEFGAFGGASAAVSGFLSWMHWVEDEVRGLPDLLEGLARLKGAAMAVGAAFDGTL